MHSAQQEFCQQIRARFPHLFEHRNVLDCGSLDVNGTNRYLFKGGTYTGVDIQPGKNVDHVGRIHEFTGGPFNTIVSTECLEHDQFATLSVRRMIDLLTSDGLLLITCATTGRAEHGTTEHEAWASPGTLGFYRNVLPQELIDPLSAAFKCWSVAVEHGDLYAWAIDKR